MVAFVTCQRKRTASAPAEATTIAPTAAPRLPSRSSRSQRYAKKKATLSLRKMMPPYAHVSGSSSVGNAMSGERTAEAEEPKPGMPEATNGFQ